MLSPQAKVFPVRSPKKCKVCGLYWLVNHRFMENGEKVRIGYYHRCGASATGKFDGKGEFVRMGLDWKPQGWQ